MSDSAFITEVGAADFDAVVIQGSYERPVLVDFWAPWCGPCQQLMPTLAKLADEYAGGFLLAKVNTEQEQALATQHAIRSIPTLRLYRNGDVVKELMGAQPEAVFRQLLDEYRVRESDTQLDAAAQAAQAGDLDSAISQANAVWVAEPDNHKAALLMAEWLLAAERLDDAKAVAQHLPDVVEGVSKATLLAKIDLAIATAGGETLASLLADFEQRPDDHGLAHKIGMRQVAEGQTEDGLKTLLALLGKAPDWNDGEARKAMLNVFEALGRDHPLVGKYRRAMFNAMH